MSQVKFVRLADSDIKALIGAIGKASVALDAKIQIAAVNCVGHAMEHGDVRMAQSLLEACTKGVRKASLVKWFETYGPFAYSGNKLVYFKNEKLTSFDGDKLLAIKWFEAVKEVIVSSIDVQDLMDKMFKRIENAIKESGKPGSPAEVKNRKLYDHLLDAAATYRAELEGGEQLGLEDESTLPALKAA